jgi:hypothetical protein
MTLCISTLVSEESEAPGEGALGSKAEGGESELPAIFAGDGAGEGLCWGFEQDASSHSAKTGTARMRWRDTTVFAARPQDALTYREIRDERYKLRIKQPSVLF